MTHYWLSIHADYACRHSGACCSSNWSIPVEPDLILVIGTEVADGYLPLTADGACIFFDRAATQDRCAIHRKLGATALPVSCRHFPRVCLVDARGVSVTLSHYCPTAAKMLFRTDRKLEVVVGPNPVPGSTIEGLDAREALPPLLTPSMLMDHRSYSLFERLMVAILADEMTTAEVALERIAAAVERLREWTPGGDSLETMVASLESTIVVTPIQITVGCSSAPDVRLFDEVRGCIPAPHSWDPAPSDLETAWKLWAEKVWPTLARPVRHYLAAKAFASWLSYQGQGLRTIVQSLRAAASIVKIEVVRAATERAAVIDADLLKEGFRRADLMLVHLADRNRLARVWSKAEGTRRGFGPRSSW